MIKVGIAGVPLALKGKSTAEGVEYLSRIGLDALEVEFVRRVSMKEETAVAVGEVARKAKIDLSVHAPYMINLASENPRIIEDSLNRVKLSVDRGHALGARIVVFHSAYYSKKYTKDETYELVTRACIHLLDYMHDHGITQTQLGVELLGRQSQFGTVEELQRLHKELPEVRPVIDFAHLQARCDGCLRTVEDYARVVQTLFGDHSHLHSHFSGIEFSKGNERRHLPVDLSQFKLLVRALKENACDATIICESPLLEQDALKMKPLVE
ncbi:MAG TPA: TIM barrel protein [Candidatus Bathyarchaeia archaeon]|nr:TIM barrel protein [Candidatus Bathyarchaeia archaeon]